MVVRVLAAFDVAPRHLSPKLHYHTNFTRYLVACRGSEEEKDKLLPFLPTFITHDCVSLVCHEDFLINHGSGAPTIPGHVANPLAICVLYSALPIMMQYASVAQSLSEIQLEHEKEDELVMVAVKVVHELDCRMAVKEIEDGILEEMELSHFGKEKFRWWFEQDIGGESKDDKEKKLVMVNEEGWMS
uniref:Uncharacterized protein n=1 Tax=Tanacetum cinerariifolium TaxID=118510 RepID=A0A6L2NGZ8_TANCI|nr:hypothetical protein [Tanacetum cinerariifolium]